MLTPEEFLKRAEAVYHELYVFQDDTMQRMATLIMDRVAPSNVKIDEFTFNAAMTDLAEWMGVWLDTDLAEFCERWWRAKESVEEADNKTQ